MLSISKTQEQMTETIEDDYVTSVQLIVPNFHNKNGVSTVSVGVGRDTVSTEIDVRQGTTSSTAKDECKYIGDIYAEKKHGKGVLSWSDGRMYTGAFFADKRHGFGSFNTPDISEFKGLYCHDERFGPGILMYKSLQSADVGLWLSEDLIRLIYPHPKLTLDIRITDRKSSPSSSLIIRSWYSPEELLPNVSDFDFLLKKKSATLFCDPVNDKNSFLTRYIVQQADRIQELTYDKREQLNAYLASLYDANNEQITGERRPDVVPPNETYEQQQLYYYVNKFWPFKQRASFPIDDIVNNTRSSFPSPGPVENASLNLFEFSFNGREVDVHDLLMERQAYVDVCDSRGLTALHFATYNAHIKVIDVLLDFGANINQVSDDGLTALTIAFLLYYGNNPQETLNTALEHTDPVILNPRTVPPTETHDAPGSKHNLKNSLSHSTNKQEIIDELKLPSSLEMMKINELERKNAYGYDLSDNLRERIRNESFRQSIYSLIKLLLRRGADPSRSDWPLPVLALTVRAGDKQMVQLLLKKRAQVNCQLDAVRHSSLTPLHIACGCLSSDALDIARQLLEHGADVNAESVPDKKEYLSLVDPLIIEANKIKNVDPRGRTPLHIACTREATIDTLNLVRLLLEYQANPNVVCNGQTPLTLAIVLGNEPLVDLLLDYQDTDPSTTLGLGNGNALCIVLSTFYEPRWSYTKRLQLIERLIAKNPKVLYPIRFGPKNTLGSSVDFSYNMFFADTRISQTPYHSLTISERATFGERKDMLTHMAKRFREEASKYEEFLRLPTPTSDGPTQTPSPANLFASRSVSRVPSLMTDKASDSNWKGTGEFRYCATCGRSTGVRLSLCKRCQKTSFCSKLCKVNGWNHFHRLECHQSLNLINPSERPVTTPKTMRSQNKNSTALDRALFKDSVLSTKTPARTSNNHRLPPLSVAKLLRQKRLKNRIGSAGNMATTVPAALEGVELSWNHFYNAPENYSFN